MKVFTTGKSSFFSKLFSKSIQNIDLVEIQSETNRSSSEMKFNLNFLNEVTNESMIIHPAWNMNTRNYKSSWEINVKGSINFFDSLSFDLKNKFIFVSTVGAHKNALSVYGKHKYEVEEHILSNGGLVLKCGLLINEEDPFSEGFFANLYNLANKVPVIPNFSGNRDIYQITKKENLQESFYELSNNQEPFSKINNCFVEKNYTFSELVKSVMGIDKKIFNIPWFIGYYASRFFELLKINFPIKSDSLLGIKEFKN